MTRPFDVVVIGGGVIGMATAWRAALQGLAVVVVDPQPGRGASWAAAGMLTPVTEAYYGEEDLLRLNLASARRYPSFVAELESASGLQVGYRTNGTLAVAADSGDRAVLEDLHRYQQELGLDSEMVSGRECRALEPMLAPGIRGGLLVAGDHQVDGRALHRALSVAAGLAGVEVRTTAVSEVLVARDRVTGVRLDNGETIAAPTVLLAAGCWSAGMAGVPPDARPPVRPVKGHILRLRSPARRPLLGRNVRGLVAGSHLYLVPRGDGRLVVGATVEEMGFDTTVMAGAVHDLLRDARAVVPGTAELELVESHAGLRPGSPDNLPIMGQSVLPGLAVATGHYRNGVLLAPVTADAMASLLVTGTTPEVIAAFSPRRFTAPVTTEAAP
ncbi:MAG: glycine oxidase ThiO [Acidimicrobiales bacterium]|nr:MAG: glycine oxidase ThiO [Acidimicrobiales bacterium]